MKAVRLTAEIDGGWTALLLFTQDEGSSDWTCVMSDSLMQELDPVLDDSFDGSEGQHTNTLYKDRWKK
jgi:hypothetical protein